VPAKVSEITQSIMCHLVSRYISSLYCYDYYANLRCSIVEARSDDRHSTAADEGTGAL